MTDKYEGSRSYEIVTRRLGAGTTLRERIVDVQTSGTLIVEPNPRRLALLLVNHGTADIRVAGTLEIASTSGIVVSGYGGTLTMVLEEDFEATCTGWYGVATGASCPLYVLEVIAQ